MTRQRLLVNFSCSHAVGHAVEALHFCLGHQTAAPDRAVSVALNAASAHELAQYCPFVESAYPIEHPFVEPGVDSAGALEAVPATWDWIVDDGRRRQDFQLRAFPGMSDYLRLPEFDLRWSASSGATSAPPARWPRGRWPNCLRTRPGRLTASISS